MAKPRRLKGQGSAGLPASTTGAESPLVPAEAGGIEAVPEPETQASASDPSAHANAGREAGTGAAVAQEAVPAEPGLPVTEPGEPEAPRSDPVDLVTMAAGTAEPATVHHRFSFVPEHFDPAGIGDAVAQYMRGEGEALAAHLRALGQARSAADLIRLQVGELQRAADASLICWDTVLRRSSRIFAAR